MYQLAYSSCATFRFGLTDLASLCERSSAQNCEAGITGLLVHDSRRFMQVIEGEVGAVRLLMCRIANDNRHDRISYIAANHITARNFHNFALACIGFEKNLTRAELLADVKASVSRIADVRLMAAFIGFARLAN
ncbi:BLUF domain-containing protein [Sphingomonas sp. PB2P19]|uniref:BLUF domain-containing protein n=1 Tax=Sphingomonas rhamnosi TaxID=3096156 RepID=UPI003FA6B375